MAQLQHDMWVTASRTAVLSIITGGGKWVEMTIPADPLSQLAVARLQDGDASRLIAHFGYDSGAPVSQEQLQASRTSMIGIAFFIIPKIERSAVGKHVGRLFF